jgi:ubiquinone/menaquinone biosynthesis C-methylase UbiE
MNFYNKYILPKLLNYEMANKNFEKERAKVVENASGIVLEIGFGSGLNIPFYKNVSKLYALDPSSELYKLADERIRKANFPIEHIKASAENIPLPNDSVDTIVSTWSMCTIPNPKLALKEMLRVLKTGGKFMFIEHGASPKKFIEKLQKIFTPITKPFTGGCRMDRKINELISNAGFEIINMKNSEGEFRPMYYLYKGVAIKK